MRRIWRWRHTKMEIPCLFLARCVICKGIITEPAPQDLVMWPLRTDPVEDPPNEIAAERLWFLLLCMWSKRPDCQLSRLSHFLLADILQWIIRPPRCHQPLKSPIAVLSCRHAYHDECWKLWYTKRPLCPLDSNASTYEVLHSTFWRHKGVELVSVHNVNGGEGRVLVLE
jgi:hypothetical protein